MTRTLLRVSVQYALVIWAVITLNFALPRLAPGDPLEYVMGGELETLTQDQRQRLQAELGLSGSVLRQYSDYVAGLTRGDLGLSLRYGRPVRDVLAERLPWTLLLAVPAALLSLLLGVVLGAAAALRRGQRRDATLLTVTLVADALPAFWIGMVLLAVFSVRLGWFPSFGATPLVPTADLWSQALQVMRHGALPLTTLVLASLGHTFLLTRGSLSTALDEDYVFMAQAKGLSERAIILRHALPNALLPLYTHFALSLGGLAGGAVLVETVFAYPGVGRLIFEAISARDYPLIQGAFLLVALGVIIANALTDLTYPLIDPRIRRPRAES